MAFGTQTLNPGLRVTADAHMTSRNDKNPQTKPTNLCGLEGFCPNLEGGAVISGLNAV